MKRTGHKVGVIMIIFLLISGGCSQNKMNEAELFDLMELAESDDSFENGLDEEQVVESLSEKEVEVSTKDMETDKELSEIDEQKDVDEVARCVFLNVAVIVSFDKSTTVPVESFTVIVSV